MKKITLATAIIIIIMAIGTSLQAQQTYKGKFIIGGDCSLNFTSLKSITKSDGEEYDNGKTSQLNFSPSVGYFINENLVVGVTLPLSFEWQKDFSYDKESIISLALAPKVRHYFSSGNIKPFVEASIGIGKAFNHFEGQSWNIYSNDIDETIKMNLFLYDVGGGVAVFLNQYVALDFRLGYGYMSAKYTEDYNSENNTDTKNITKGLQTHIGFSITL